MSASIRTKHALATGLAVVLSGGGLAVVAAPAHATTGSVTYTCSAAGQTFDLPVVIDSDAPAKMYVGDSVTPTITADTALPGSLAQLAKTSFGAESFDGSVVADGALNGTPVPVNQTIPNTLLGDQTTPTPVPFRATGQAPLPLKPGAPGDLVLTAGNFDATFNFKKADGTAAAPPIGATCTLPGGKAPVIDTVVVVSRSSTALTLSRTRAGYGAPVTATAKVTTPGGTPAGDVTFVVDGVSTKVQVKDGAASLVINQAAVGDNPVSATFTPKDTTHYEGSSATPVNLEVTKAATSTRVKIIGKRVGERTSARIKVVGINKTVPTGKVKLVLRKAGNKGFHKVRRGTLAKGTRGFNLGRLGKGKYKVAVKYKGDSNHRRSKTVKRFRVRR
ncbi:adhesin-like protein [Nocardioides sp. CF8]|uniref:Ig-like domain-containing protein n=1 Tax=Nocardioides sp. CF8 TaxID=110319 RepID=UPI00032FA59F|nr:Ig-like domain-containing protein [Nocardioides sp. CF8]EON24457.1 adhesin-like protein [Nocardioides sp. CF8]